MLVTDAPPGALYLWSALGYGLSAQPGKDLLFFVAPAGKAYQLDPDLCGEQQVWHSKHVGWNVLSLDMPVTWEQLEDRYGVQATRAMQGKLVIAISTDTIISKKS